MPDTISQQLDEVLRQASVSFVRNMLRTEQDLAEFEAVSHGANERREEVTRLYHEQYDTRLDAARQRLYDEAAQFNLDHPPPPGGGSDRAGAINREAQRRVQLAHEADLQRADNEAQQAFEDLLDRAYRRNQAKGMATEAFLSSRERRSGDDRRTPKHSQD